MTVLVPPENACSRALCLIGGAAAGFVLAACGSGAKQTAHYTTSPPTTIAGVGVITSGPVPRPSTPTACARRWSSASNADARAAAMRGAPKASQALVRTAASSGYFGEYAGRCLVYLVAPGKRARVFVETAPGRFSFTADASGWFSTNAELQPDGRIRLR